jgi:hypothetical protein
MAQSPFFRLAASPAYRFKPRSTRSTWIEKTLRTLAVTATDHQADRLSIG